MPAIPSYNSQPIKRVILCFYTFFPALIGKLPLRDKHSHGDRNIDVNITLLESSVIKKIIALSLLTVSTASALADTTLHSTLNVDDIFSLYISTDDTAQGTLVGTGDDWRTALSSDAVLTPGVTNYLHLVARNTGGPGGVLGSFSLSDSNFVFANGSATMLTGDAGLVQNTTGFGNAYAASVDEGANGTNAWALRAGNDVNAHWVWNYMSLNGGGDTQTLYFSAAITSAVPEPESYAMLLGGLGMLAFMVRRRKV